MSPRAQATSTANTTVTKPPGKCTTKSGKKPAPEADDNPQEPHKKGSRVQWDNTRTDRLIKWLEDNPEDRQCLFSNSSHNARKENQPRCVAKGSKSTFHVKMADEEVKEEAKKYAKAVKNRITHLKRKYQDFNTELRRTGAGLSVDEIWRDDDLSNLLGKLLHTFPMWECLYGFWCTLPSFNPHTVSSKPGQNLESEALGLLFGNQDNAQDNISGVGGGGVGGKEVNGLQELDGPVQHTEGQTGTASDREVDHLKDLTLDVPENDPDLVKPVDTPVTHKPYSHLLMHHRTPSVASSADQSSKSAGPARKGSSGKRTRIESSLEVSVSKHTKLLELARGSYKLKTTTLVVKHQKMELKAEQERDGQRYAAEERALVIKERMWEKEIEHQKTEFEHWEWMIQTHTVQA
ncbi:hypothetical protein EDB84DRAFT_1444962 [Lactarius hengduanensis]|nr:hypothetical protein EDB84DRAFT_1444962 [Lactarius hengduanensis]